MEQLLAIGTICEFSGTLAGLTEIRSLSEFNSFEKVFSVVWFSGFSDVSFYCEVKYGYQEVQI